HTETLSQPADVALPSAPQSVHSRHNHWSDAPTWQVGWSIRGRERTNGATRLPVDIVNYEVIEVISTGVDKLPARESQIADNVLNKIDVTSELEGVITTRHRDCIRKLITAFVWKSRPLEKFWYPEADNRIEARTTTVEIGLRRAATN